MSAAEPIGVILAGGLGRRLGGEKAVVTVAGRPLLSYPLAALRGVCARVAVVAKRETFLPAMDEDVAIWLEPDEPRHPLTGLVEALRRAAGHPVLACAVDLALVDPPTLQLLLDAARPADVAVVARAEGRLQPLCALYGPGALHALADAGADARMSDTVQALGPRVVDLPDAAALMNVNAPEDVLVAAASLRARQRA